MYQHLPSFILGFHGCDRRIGEDVLAGKTKLKFSENKYDWLGTGVYFWENDPERALSYAKSLVTFRERAKSHIYEPFVLGAVIDLGLCLNLTDENASLELEAAYDSASRQFKAAKLPLPENAKGFTSDKDLIKRNLDCAIFAVLHQAREEAGLAAYDTVRAPFWEGEPMYPGSGFTKRAHIQICVRSTNCIKGYFRPLNEDGSPRLGINK